MKIEHLMLREFHRAFAHHCPLTPTLAGYPFELRCRLILEEAQEFVEACGYAISMLADLPDNDGGMRGIELRVEQREHNDGTPVEPNWVEMIDALCDLLYVTIGGAVAMGLDLTEMFEEVHRSNMQKLGGKTNEFGKTEKPRGWKPPNLRAMLLDALAEAKPNKHAALDYDIEREEKEAAK